MSGFACSRCWRGFLKGILSLVFRTLQFKRVNDHVISIRWNAADVTALVLHQLRWPSWHLLQMPMQLHDPGDQLMTFRATCTLGARYDFTRLHWFMLSHDLLTLQDLEQWRFVRAGGWRSATPSMGKNVRRASDKDFLYHVSCAFALSDENNRW